MLPGRGQPRARRRRPRASGRWLPSALGQPHLGSQGRQRRGCPQLPQAPPPRRVFLDQDRRGVMSTTSLGMCASRLRRADCGLVRPTPSLSPTGSGGGGVCDARAVSLRNPKNSSRSQGLWAQWTTAYWRIGPSRCAVVQGLWTTTDRTLMVCGRVRVVVHSPAASTGRRVCTAHVRGGVRRSGRRGLGPTPRPCFAKLQAARFTTLAAA